MWSKMCVKAVIFLTLCGLSYQARIGDGRVSLYTGRIIDSNSTRGSCEVDGHIFPSETAIPRDHPCHYCICYQSQITCYWKQCAAPPRDCAVMYFENVCNPSLYVCKIPEKAVREPKRRFGDRISGLRRKRLIREANSISNQLTLPIHEPFPVEIDDTLLERVERELSGVERELSGIERELSGVDRELRVKRAVSDINALSHNHPHLHTKTCTILGVVYNLGEVIGVASDVCMECRCADGKMFCSPRCCFGPSPLNISRSRLRQLESQQPDKPKPHPLSYVRNQYVDQPYLNL